MWQATMNIKEKTLKKNKHIMCDITLTGAHTERQKDGKSN